ncbi:MAG: DUF1109 domain-containing protein [Propionivibrio sp.]
MKTDELISLLATGNERLPANVATRRFAIALAAGVLGATLIMLATIGIRANLADDVDRPMFWVKFGFVAGLAFAALVATRRLARPGASLKRVPGLFATPLLFVWAVAVVVLFDAEPGQRLALVYGSTWVFCPFLIAMLSVPVFIAVIWAMKGLAPIRPRLSGAAAGFLAGATGAFVYCFHCPELDAPFLGIWYLIGMLIPTAIGALLGRRLLRW